MLPLHFSYQNLSAFIDRPCEPLVKAAYFYKNERDRQKMTDGAWYLLSHVFFAHECGFLKGRYGHPIVFMPHPQSFLRLTYEQAFMEYALHFVSSQSGEQDRRIFDVAKHRVLDIFYVVLQDADGCYITPDGVNYYKKTEENNRSVCVIVMKMSLDQQRNIFRVAGIMPNRKENYIKKAAYSLGRL